MASAEFYVAIFDLEFREGDEVMGNRQSWLIDRAGRDVIHFRLMEVDSNSTGPIDHVALDCDGIDDILKRLTERAVKYALVDDLLPGITQVFLQDPHGVSLELQFKH